MLSCVSFAAPDRIYGNSTEYSKSMMSKLSTALYDVTPPHETLNLSRWATSATAEPRRFWVSP